MADYTLLTDDEFDRILADKVDETPGCSLLSIPGVYELLSEHFNNAVLEKWEQDNPELAYPNED